MNSIIQTQGSVLTQTQALRSQLMDLLTDEDLQFRLPGDNPSLGELCREIGEIERVYIQSFKTFTTDLSYRHPDPSIANSVERLKAWYADLDAELFSVLEALSEDEIQNKMVARGPEFSFPVMVQFHVYREALLIFYAKASVYLKALQKSNVSEQWQQWIG